MLLFVVAIHLSLRGRHVVDVVESEGVCAIGPSSADDASVLRTATHRGAGGDELHLHRGIQRQTETTGCVCGQATQARATVGWLRPRHMKENRSAVLRRQGKGIIVVNMVANTNTRNM